MRDSNASGRPRNSFERHGEVGWYEWTFREFFRYLFGIGILALAVFVPLQMELSWVPGNSPPAFDPTLVAVVAIVSLIAISGVAIVGYQAVWGDDGWVERKLARRSATPRALEGKDSSKRPPR